MNNTLWV